VIIVSNTSPISNLTLIGQIPLLQQIYPKIIIPPAVHTELIRLPKLQSMITSFITEGWLEIKPPQNFQLLQTLNQVLDPGESEAIALAVMLGADRLLIDEH
jgi:uncharacterized protein